MPKPDSTPRWSSGGYSSSPPSPVSSSDTKERVPRGRMAPARAWNHGPVTINSGIDLSAVDSAARPQDDLFGYLNGRWLAEYEIPPDLATDGAFRMLHDRAEEQVRDLIERAADGTASREPSPDERRIGDLYATFMDEDTVARVGLAPLRDELASVDDAADAAALAAVVGRLQRTGVGGGASVYVDTDSKDSTRYL